MVLSAVPCTFPVFGLILLVSLSRYVSVFVMFRMNMNLSLVCVSETEGKGLSLASDNLPPFMWETKTLF